MNIDHEAAKATAFHYSHNTPNVTEPCVVNLALAHLDLHEQLTAERARVDALAELVPVAYQSGKCHGIDFGLTDESARLDRIMEGRA